MSNDLEKALPPCIRLTLARLGLEGWVCVLGTCKVKKRHSSIQRCTKSQVKAIYLRSGKSVGWSGAPGRGEQKSG